MNQPFKYDVALSFAGEDRDYVSQVAATLKARGVAVFYDEFYKLKLWGKELYEYLDEIYRKKARYCIIFISVQYANKVWPSHERRSAQARAFQSNEEYILPARFDDTEIPGIRPTVGYIDLSSLKPDQFAELVVQKLDQVPTDAKPVTPVLRDSTKLQVFFNPEPPLQATLSEIDNAAKQSMISVFNPRSFRTLRFPVSFLGGFFEKDSDSLLFQKERHSSIKDETRQDSFRITTDGSFQSIDIYHLKADRYHLFSTDYLAEQLIYSFIFGRRWLEHFAAKLTHDWQQIVVRTRAAIPNKAIIFDQMHIVNTKLEHAYFNEISGEAEGIIRFPFKDLADSSLIGKHVARLMDYIVNPFEYESNGQKGFASVAQNKIALFVKEYEKEIVR